MEESQQPGQIIIPHPSGEQSKPATNPAPAAQLPTPQPLPAAPTTPAAVLPSVSEAPPAEASPSLPSQSPAPQNPPVAVSAPEAMEEPQAPPDQDGWKFHQESGSSNVKHHEPAEQGVTWTASQFLQHDKGAGWYAALSFGGILAVAGIYFLTKDKITTGIIVATLFAFGVYASRKPRSEQYSVSEQGVLVGNKAYAFNEFKTFSVVDEGSAASIVFMPMKRFMPPITIYVTNEVEDRVVDFLSAYLPSSEHKADVVDKLLHRIRF